jgi:hemerythrin
MTLQWTEELAVGYPAIDNQHKELINKFTQFLDACHQHKGKVQLGELFGFLDNYVVLHFREEEQLMEQHQYPDLLTHRKHHQEFIRRLKELRSELAQEGSTISVLIHTNKALLYWLSTHIKQVDVALGKYLASSTSAERHNHPDPASAPTVPGRVNPTG